MTVCRTRFGGRRASGHTLIELMVAIIIGLIMVLASFQVLATFEGHKRTTSAMNDALQSGNFGLFMLDKLSRSAGTGLAQATSPAYGSFGSGCVLNYTAPGGTVAGGVPTPALGAPFQSIVADGGGRLRLAPAVIFPGADADVLLMMSGGGGYGETPIPITPVPAATSLLTVESTVGLRPDDWVLLGGGGAAQCLITQVVTVPNDVVMTLSAGGSLTPYANGFVIGLGKGQAASFTAYGVLDDSLLSLDLLNSDLSTPQVVSDDVVTMRAAYGVDPGNTGTLTWVTPAAGWVVQGNTYNFSPAGLLEGTAAASTALRAIKAIRAAMIVRAPLSERRDASDVDVGAGHAVNAGSYLLFKSLPLAVQTTYTVPAGQAGYRYRVLESTVPIRNAPFFAN